MTGKFSVLPIFHPAAAIYDRSKEPTMEADFKLLGRLIVKRREDRALRETASGLPEKEGSQTPTESDNALVPAGEAGVRA